MTLTLLTIPCLEDNYAFVIANEVTKEAALIDAPEAEPINAALAKTDYRLTTVLLTHHHWDHVEGLTGLVGFNDLKIIGGADDMHRLPPLHQSVREGDIIDVCGEAAHIFDVSGHTIGHIAFHFPSSKIAFTADSLMAMGCGRLSEGTPDQMWDSLKKLRALPDDTVICSGHEYTASNTRFALTIEPDNAELQTRAAEIAEARKNDAATVPSLLSVEKATNPFLRADVQALKDAVGMSNEADNVVFAAIRKRKDMF